MVCGYKPEETIHVTEFFFFFLGRGGGGEGIYIFNLSFRKCDKLSPIDLRITN